jgi:hypothetical protein
MHHVTSHVTSFVVLYLPSSAGSCLEPCPIDMQLRNKVRVLSLACSTFWVARPSCLPNCLASPQIHGRKHPRKRLSISTCSHVARVPALHYFLSLHANDLQLLSFHFLLMPPRSSRKAVEPASIAASEAVVNVDREQSDVRTREPSSRSRSRSHPSSKARHFPSSRSQPKVSSQVLYAP